MPRKKKRTLKYKWNKFKESSKKQIRMHWKKWGAGVVGLIICLVFLCAFGYGICCHCSYWHDKGKDKIHKEAWGFGYGTYDDDGNFTWKERE